MGFNMLLMRQKHFAMPIMLVILSLASANISAEVYTAADLGGKLTPMGGIKAGNDDGTIPAWEGGITQPPANYKKGDHHPNPFVDDKILFIIDSTNYQQYQDKLSPGQIAMLQQYKSSFKMPVYPTHRSASFPQKVYDMVKTNATQAKLVEDGNGIQGAVGASPFPIPQNGLQAIWNHTMRYRGDTFARKIGQAAVTAGGAYTMLRYEDELLFTYGTANFDRKKYENKIFLFKQFITAPARLAGRILVAHETINAVKEPRAVWIYNPGLRRVRRAPDVVYDSPPPGTDALRTVDQFDMYNGAPNRYDWTLAGRKEMYVPYNAYKLHAKGIPTDDIIKPKHINSDLTRYELHRVWVVEANLKKDERHIYTKRVFYIDEDSWQILAIDQYDGRGKLWRVSEAHALNYYEVPLLWSTLEIHYDLQSQRYLVFGINNNSSMYDFSIKRDPKDFNPAALRRAGRR